MPVVDVPLLVGTIIRLEPLRRDHATGLARASAQDPTLYGFTPVPQGLDAATAYIDAALDATRKGNAAPFATVRRADGAVLGSTRFWDLEWWPPSPGETERTTPHGCEIGYTWLAREAIRTAANTEAKALMLTHAFDAWRVHRVCLHTDARNERSRAAIERIGASFEGVLRAHRRAVEGGPRDSARYSITAAEWPEAKERLSRLLARRAT